MTDDPATGRDGPPTEPTHWERRSRWPGLVLVVAIAAAIALVWVIARATGGSSHLSDDVGPQVTAYLKATGAPEVDWVAGYSDGDSGVVRIETTLAGTASGQRDARALCTVLHGHHFSRNPQFEVLAADGSTLLRCD